MPERTCYLGKNLGNVTERVGPVNLARSGGFSLFELVVFIICVAIVYAVAANRFAEFPEAAERANFFAVTTEIQTGVNLELLLGLIGGSSQRLANYEDSNPMDFLLQAPSNYLGAFDFVDTDRLTRRSWYFDRQQGELVYLVNNSDNVFLLANGSQLPTDEIRFKIEMRYLGDRRGETSFSENEAIGSGDNNQNRRLSGMILTPVVPYHWGASALALPEVTISQVSG